MIEQTVSEQTVSEHAAYAPNAVVHFDISGPDTQGLYRFYRNVLGWRVQPQEPGDARVHTPGGPSGAITAGAQPRVTLGVTVADLEQALCRAAQSGGTVVVPPTDNGWVIKARISDPAGNLLTLIQA
jgi:predicted enzyme related to lactoylglutathione lyase